MKKILIATLGLVAASLAGIVLTAGAAGTAPPTLHIESDAPLVVRGLHFGSTEGVSLTVRTGSKATATKTGLKRRLETGTAGGFVARFPGVSLENCKGYLIVAVADDGSRASLAAKPHECAPGPAEG